MSPPSPVDASSTAPETAAGPTVAVLGAIEEAAAVDEVTPIEPPVGSTTDQAPTDDRSLVATALPEHIDLSPSFVAGNAGLSGLVVLALLAAAQLFNDALKARHDDLAQRLGSRSSAMARAKGFAGAFPQPPPLATFALAAAVLGLLADPRVRVSVATLAQVVGMILGIALIAVTYDGSAAQALRRETGTATRFRLYPIAIAMAIVCLFLSRLVGVAPGVLYGLFTGLAVAQAVDRRTEGRAYARSSLLLVGVALVAFFVQRAVAPAASESHPSFAVLVIDTAAAVVFVGGLQAVIVQLLPTRFVNGEKIAAWSRPGWLVLLVGSVLLYLQLVVRPNHDQQHWGSIWFVAALVVGALVFWAWSAWLGLRRSREVRATETQGSNADQDAASPTGAP